MKHAAAAFAALSLLLANATQAAGTIVIEEPGEGSQICNINSTGTSASQSFPNAIGKPVDSSAPLAFIPNGESNTVTAIDTGNGMEHIETIAVGINPYGIAIDQRGLHAYIGNRDSNNISIIDTLTLSVVDTVALTGKPIGLALDENDQRLFVTLEDSSSLAIIDTTTLETILVIELDYPSHDISVKNGVIHLLSRSQGYISRLHASSLTEIDHRSLVSGAYTTPTAMTVSNDGRTYIALAHSDSTSSLILALDDITQFELAIDDYVIRDLALSSNNASLYIAPDTGASCTQIIEVSATLGEVLGQHPVPGQAPRIITSTNDLFAISHTHEALVNPIGNSLYRVADSGPSPMAMGNFIGPTYRPAMTSDATTIDFGNITIGSSSTTTLTVRNTGNLPLRIYEIEIAAQLQCSPFLPCGDSDISGISISGGTCSSDELLSIDDTCTIDIQFAPADEGSRSANLNIHTNGSTIPQGPNIMASSTAPTGTGNTDNGATSSGDSGGGGAFLPLWLELMAAAGIIILRRRTEKKFSTPSTSAHPT